MKSFLSSRGLFVLALFIIIATNIVIFIGISSNRSGEPTSQLVLTERELSLPYRYIDEDSGMSLLIDWRVLDKDWNRQNSNYANRWGTPEWFDSEKLNELGFDNLNHYRIYDYNKRKQTVSKEVFIVLEYGGSPYKEALRRAESALAQVKVSFVSDSKDDKSDKNREKAEEALTTPAMPKGAI